jgi:hypothetical protein
MIIKTTEKIKNIICDCCGNSCNATPNEDKPNFEYLELKSTWGYFSKDKDTELWSAQVCEKCVDEKLSPIIKFTKGNYL